MCSVLNIRISTVFRSIVFEHYTCKKCVKKIACLTHLAVACTAYVANMYVTCFKYFYECSLNIIFFFYIYI